MPIFLQALYLKPAGLHIKIACSKRAKIIFLNLALLFRHSINPSFVGEIRKFARTVKSCHLENFISIIILHQIFKFLNQLGRVELEFLNGTSAHSTALWSSPRVLKSQHSLNLVLKDGEPFPRVMQVSKDSVGECLGFFALMPPSLKIHILPLSVAQQEPGSDSLKQDFGTERRKNEYSFSS